MVERVAEARALVLESQDPNGLSPAHVASVAPEMGDLLDDEVIVYDLEDETDE